MAGTHILGIAYGLDIRDGQDPHIVDAKIVVDAFSAGSIPGAFLVDTFPFCTYLLNNIFFFNHSFVCLQ